MRKFLNKYKYLLLTFLVSFVIFYPSLFGFFTNDDFFHLKISHATSLLQFLNFFNLESGSAGQLLYRPLTTHVFYFLEWQFFNLNPLPLHVVSFILFFIVIFCVYKLAVLISENEKVGFIAAFLYAVSATHFGHLYYLATEIILGVFFFPAVIFFTLFLKNKSIRYYCLSLLFFVLALFAKENSVVLPGVLAIIFVYLYLNKNTKVRIKNFLVSLIPFAVIILIYLYFHFFYYGFVKGDSYIWDFSFKRALNTGFWYLVWSFNIPESVVDFVGPGFKLNYNLFAYWGNQIRPVLILFIAQMVIIAAVLIKSIKSLKRDLVSIFCALWFVGTLLPVLFFPYHKFTFYLTLPLFAIVFRIAYLFATSKINKIILYIFLVAWTVTSVLTLKFTYETNWISQGENVAKRVYEYINTNKGSLTGKKICFYDTKEDMALPFSPTGSLKSILSDNNFFEVFYGGKITAFYEDSGNKAACQIKVSSRQFLGY
jgi:hypothetical protein